MTAARRIRASVLMVLACVVQTAHAGTTLPCVGDCNRNGSVVVNELVLGVNIALGFSAATMCETMDRNGSLTVSCDELVQAVNALLRGCTDPVTPSPTPTLELPTATPPAPTQTPTVTIDVPSATPESTPTATETPVLPTATITNTPALLAMLKQGGLVIHWRHSAATVCQDCLAAGKADNTTIPNWWKSCEATCPATPAECTTAGLATARQLDATGVMEATTVGEFFDEQEIPIGRVLSSEYCRCFGTAELMDFGPAIEQRSEITYAVYDEDNRCANSMALIAEVPSAGTNTAIIGHAGFGNTCPILSELAWSEAAIFKPDGQGGSTLIARVLWDDWRSLP